jgi:hypothetical protein
MPDRGADSGRAATTAPAATRHPRSGSSGGWPGRGAVVTPAAMGPRYVAARFGPHRECAKLHLKSLWLSRIRRASRIGPGDRWGPGLGDGGCRTCPRAAGRSRFAVIQAQKRSDLAHKSVASVGIRAGPDTPR